MSLLDTSTLLWTVGNPERLSQSAERAATAKDTRISVASYWEIIIKARKKMLPTADPVRWWARIAELFGNRVLSISTSHVTALAALPDLHRDPFDRILIAQAIADGLELVTSDGKIAQYPVRVIW